VRKGVGVRGCARVVGSQSCGWVYLPAVPHPWRARPCCGVHSAANTDAAAAQTSGAGGRV